MLCCVALRCVALRRVVLCCAVLCCVLHCVVFCVVLCCVVLACFVVFGVSLCYVSSVSYYPCTHNTTHNNTKQNTAQRSTALHNTTQHQNRQMGRENAFIWLKVAVLGVGVGGRGGSSSDRPCVNTIRRAELRERGNDTSRSTGLSGRQKAATRRNMRREERVTAQGPVKKRQPDGMPHEGVHPSTGPVLTQ